MNKVCYDRENLFHRYMKYKSLIFITQINTSVQTPSNRQQGAFYPLFFENQGYIPPKFGQYRPCKGQVSAGYEMDRWEGNKH